MTKDNSNDKNKITKRSSGSDSGSSRSSTDSSSGVGPLESQAPSPMCSRGCGFFGNASFGGLCSMCYREHKSRQQPQEDSSSSKKASGPAKSKSSSVASNTSTTPVKNVASSSGTSRPPTPYPKNGATSQAPMDLSAKSEKTKQPNPTPTKATPAKPSIPESITESPEDGSTAQAATTKRKLEEETQATSPAKSNQVAKCAITPTTSSPLASGTSPSPKKPRKERCVTCGASIAVIAFDCRCGGRFCVKHQLANAHECNFDYRTAGQEEIAKNNPKVVADKIQKL